jgi:hypothetical protein
MKTETKEVATGSGISLEELKALGIDVGMGAGADIAVSDIRIGRIAILQKTSELVDKKIGNVGDICNFDNQEILPQPCELIFLKSIKYWITKKGDEFVSRKPAFSADELPWEEEGGVKNMYHHAFYVLLPSEIESGMAMPYEISFKSTTLDSARKLSKYFMLLAKKGQPSFFHTFTMATEKQTKDKNTWYAPVVNLGREATRAEIIASGEWLKVINSASAGEIVVTEEV